MEMTGIPFIGENGFYPNWAKGAGRWVFQRTLISVGGIMAGYAELVAASVPTSNQVIVWVPKRRGLLGHVMKSSIHQERELAIHHLSLLHIICYVSECTFKVSYALEVRATIQESGINPEDWFLLCPRCNGPVGPDLTTIQPAPIIQRWEKFKRPSLDNPGASEAFRSALLINDLPEWIKKNDPSHLELAYLGQQMWPSIDEMLNDIVG